MERPHFTLYEAAAPACTSVRISQRRLKAGDLNRLGLNRFAAEAELEADGLLIASLGARAAQPGKP